MGSTRSLGIPDQVCDRAEAYEKVVRTFADSPEMANKWINAGAQYIAYPVDGAILTFAYEDVVDDVNV